MKSILILAALTIASSVNAGDIWLDSVHGSYNCTTDRDEALKVNIDSVEKKISYIVGDKSGEAIMLDETESLGIMQREVGLHQFKIMPEKDKAMTFVMFRTSTGKLLIREHAIGSADGWELPAFRPDAVCDKTN